MNEFDEECLNVFLENQSQLFEEAVAETLEDAEAFQGMSDEELEEAAEVFPIPDGRYLIVEG